MGHLKEDYSSLELQYRDPSSLMSQKVDRVATYVKGGRFLLDVGCGTGELISRMASRFELIYGMDHDEEAINICTKKLSNVSNVKIIQGDISDLRELCGGLRFDYITVLDVMEHLDQGVARKALSDINALLAEQGKLILTTPNWYDHLWSRLHTTDHKHFHSSLGWRRFIESAGLRAIRVQTIRFPVIKSAWLAKRLHLLGMCVLIVAEKGAKAGC